MKYWLLTTEYPPMHGGGISTYCLHTAHMLAAAGYTVTIFVNDDTVQDYEMVREPHCRVIRFTSRRHQLQSSLGYTAGLSYAFAGIVKTLVEKEGKPDCIESQDYLGIAYYLTQFKHAGYSFLQHVPVIITIHSPAFIYLLYNRVPVYRFPDYWTGEMEKQALVAADGLISPSRFMAEELRKHLSLEGREPAIIPNPFITSNIDPPNFERNKLVYYGKLSMQKGSFALLDRFRDMWNAGFPHTLEMIGGTDIVFYPEMKTMGELVKQRYGAFIANGCLQLAGKIQPQAISQVLSTAHVVIVPSIVDNMPYVVMEAMSLGKIVLASIQGGQAEMIEEGVSGFLFDHTDPASFQRQLEHIQALPDETVKAIGANAIRSIANSYAYHAIAARKIQFIEALVSAKPSGKEFPFLYQQPVQPITASPGTPGLLSVVIPYYNMGRWIDDCVQSVLQSTYTNIEILIINDGSTEAASIEKLSSFSQYSNITVINRANAGLAATRNFGAGAGKGQFLAFLDADDQVLPGYYEKAIHLLQQKSNVYFVGCWVQYFENSRYTWVTFTPQPPYALLHNPVNSSSLVYKRAAFIAGGLNDCRVDYGMEDYESVLQMLHNGFNGVVLPEVLFCYRVRTGSMFRNITNAKLLYSNNYITAKHQAYYAKFLTDTINLLNANGPGYLYDNPSFEISVKTISRRESAIVHSLKSFVKKNAALKRMALHLLKLKSGI